MPSPKPRNTKMNNKTNNKTNNIANKASKPKSKTNNQNKKRPPAMGNNSGINEVSVNIVTAKKIDGLHEKNRHKGRYDITALSEALPELKQHIVLTPVGEQSIDFSNQKSVKLLNKALLAYYYGVTQWDIPAGYLCPPIPGRSDYVHRLAAFLAQQRKGFKQHLVNALDVGVGANCIYPIIGVTEYKWSCVGSDVDPVSVQAAQNIADSNDVLNGKIECRLQNNSRHFFKGIIKPGEYYDVTTCNPPFHKSQQDAEQGTARKLTNLSQHREKRGALPKLESSKDKLALNFGGQKAELWCEGGEAAFIKEMALESRHFALQVLWFSTLISKKDNVRWMCKNLEKAGAVDIYIEEMAQGQKISRFIAWTFKSEQERNQWLKLKS